MKIIKKQGSKFKGDILYLVTMKEEPFSIIKFCVLNNYLAKNEYKIHKESIDRTGNFFFAQAMEEAIKMGKEGIDFREWLNQKENFDSWCKKYFFVGSTKTRALNEIKNEIQTEIEGVKE